MGYQHLELCMIVVEELKKSLFGAEILYRMFTKAQRQIRDQRLAIAPTATFTHDNQMQTYSGSMSIGDMGDTLDNLRAEGDELDAFSAIWGFCAPMASYEFLNDSE
jgi:hypothetical protein